MNAKPLLKSVAASSVIAALLTVTTGCVTEPGGYNAYGDIYQDIYKDTDLYKKHKKTIETIDKEIYRPGIEQRAANIVSNMSKIILILTKMRWQQKGRRFYNGNCVTPRLTLQKKR